MTHLEQQAVSSQTQQSYVKELERFKKLVSNSLGPGGPSKIGGSFVPGRTRDVPTLWLCGLLWRRSWCTSDGSFCYGGGVILCQAPQLQERVPHPSCCPSDKSLELAAGAGSRRPGCSTVHSWQPGAAKSLPNSKKRCQAMRSGICGVRPSNQHSCKPPGCCSDALPHAAQRALHRSEPQLPLPIWRFSAEASGKAQKACTGSRKVPSCRRGTEFPSTSASSCSFVKIRLRASGAARLVSRTSPRSISQLPVLCDGSVQRMWQVACLGHVDSLAFMQKSGT